MRSTLDATNRTEIARNAVRLAHFLELSFPSGTLRSTTASRDLLFSGNTFTANAVLVGFDGVIEVADLKSRRMSLKLSGLDATLILRVLTDRFQYRSAKLWLGFFSESWELLATPHALADNLLMSSASISYERGERVISMALETRDLFGQRDSAVLVTPEQQRLRYAGDSGVDRITSIQSEEIQWGGAFQRS